MKLKDIYSELDQLNEELIKAKDKLELNNNSSSVSNVYAIECDIEKLKKELEEKEALEISFDELLEEHRLTVEALREIYEGAVKGIVLDSTMEKVKNILKL